jgi:hypothetical protein
VTAPAAPIGKLVLRTFLWLPPCFAVWYLIAPYHAAVAGWLARVGLSSAGIVSGLEREGLNLVFVTRIVVHPAPGQDAVLLPEVNPLIYTYGLALFVALMLAARAGWRQVLVGIAVLLPFQAWGIAFDFLAQVGIKLGPAIAAQAGVQGWRVEAVALGYQVGTLLFPSLVPVVLWAIFTRPFVLKSAEVTS